MTDLNTFWEKNKVFIFGLLSAAAIAIYQLQHQEESESGYKPYILAGVMAILSYVAKEWRGKTGSILGFIGIAAGAIAYEMSTGQPINWWQLATGLLAIYLSSVSAPAKADTYETNATIVRAKTIPAQQQTEDVSPTVPPVNKSMDQYGTK